MITLDWVINYETKGTKWLFPEVERWFGIKEKYIKNHGLIDGMPDLDFLS